MKKTKLLGIGITIILFMIQFTSYSQNTVLKGQLKGLSDGEVTLYYNNKSQSITDTVKAVDDHFEWKSNLDEPVRVALNAGKEHFFFFAEPGQLTLVGIKDSLSTYNLKGSLMQEHEDLYRASTRNLMQEWDSLYKKIDSVSDEEKAVIERRRVEISQQFIVKAHEFVATHPTSPYSLYLINLENEYAVIKRLYAQIGPSAKNTSAGKSIALRLEKMSRRQIGSLLENFTQPDTAGHPVDFQQFRGQYVLVDFWASWCMPCRAENPNVLKAYQKFKDKGFTVLGISLDEKASNWKKAIKDDDLPWTQLSDLKGWKSDLVNRLGIEFIPSNVLVDPEGKIIATDLRGEMLEEQLKELFE